MTAAAVWLFDLKHRCLSHELPNNNNNNYSLGRDTTRKDNEGKNLYQVIFLVIKSDRGQAKFLCEFSKVGGDGLPTLRRIYFK